MSEERQCGCDGGVRDVCMSEERHGGCDSGVRDVCAGIAVRQTHDDETESGERLVDVLGFVQHRSISTRLRHLLRTRKINKIPGGSSDVSVSMAVNIQDKGHTRCQEKAHARKLLQSTRRRMLGVCGHGRCTVCTQYQPLVRHQQTNTDTNGERTYSLPVLHPPRSVSCCVISSTTTA
jgi:hypothetical protein